MEFTQIGSVTTTHGIKGELKIRTMSGDLDRYMNLEKLYMGDERKELNISQIRIHKGVLIIKFEEFDNINEVIGFKDKKIYAREEDLLELEEDEYYIHDIIGCEVYDLEENHVGKLEEIMQGVANDVYVIRKDKREFLIPAVREFIKEIDIDEMIIIIDPIDGMIE